MFFARSERKVTELECVVFDELNESVAVVQNGPLIGNFRWGHQPDTLVFHAGNSLASFHLIQHGLSHHRYNPTIHGFARIFNGERNGFEKVLF